jgi:hypothetical protein
MERGTIGLVPICRHEISTPACKGEAAAFVYIRVQTGKIEATLLHRGLALSATL